MIVGPLLVSSKKLKFFSVVNVVMFGLSQTEQKWQT